MTSFQQRTWQKAIRILAITIHAKSTSFMSEHILNVVVIDLFWHDANPVGLVSLCADFIVAKRARDKPKVALRGYQSKHT